MQLISNLILLLISILYALLFTKFVFLASELTEHKNYSSDFSLLWANLIE